MGHIAQLAEVDLNGYELVLEVDLVDTGGQDQPGQLLRQGLHIAGAEISKVNLGCHGVSSDRFIVFFSVPFLSAIVKNWTQQSPHIFQELMI